ncbi:receptor-type tyrosine-protein phosphatase H-like [Pempheris klunzingeri]|uniref:receptor-type tyrosine-protein phosphatase H-like n=1 Tax=Pempheris klunzingeri TaxID=3127111 RepID=UPI00397FE92E
MVTHTSVTVTDLPVGTEITLSVTALANDTLKGDTVTVVSYTAPEPISNLILVTKHNSLTAQWDSVGNQNFTVHLKLHNELVGNCNVTNTTKQFDGLKTASKYTVIVFSVSGNHRSQEKQESAFTLPLSPTNVKVNYSNSSQISLEWGAPDNIENASYLVNMSSSFWNQSWSVPVSNQKTHRFNDLISGTNYTLSVQTMAGELLSEPVNVSHFTDARKVEIGLSMLCSSAESLFCDMNSTRHEVFQKLNEHFNNLLQDHVFWELKKEQTDN